MSVADYVTLPEHIEVGQDKHRMICEGDRVQTLKRDTRPEVRNGDKL
jgi:hypothetical protein